MGRSRLEVAEVFQQYGQSYRQRYGPSLSPEQWRVMNAIERCRTAALGGHVDRCDQCGHEHISYNSCRNRHCPKCQNLKQLLWAEERRAELLPADYYHAVFTLPALLRPLALQNKKVVYDLLFRAVSRALLCIGADPKHLGAELGFVAVLHTWGQTLVHHPHVHCLIPGGGIAPDSERWIACKRRFFLSNRVLSRLFRRLFLEGLQHAYDQGQLKFHGDLTKHATPKAFRQLLGQSRSNDWVVHITPPFAGPETVVHYLARYTQRIAISNRRLLHMANGNVTFSYKDYNTGANKTMTLEAHEFIRRFLLHVLPNGFQRIRYYGFMANCHRKEKLERCHALLGQEQTKHETASEDAGQDAFLKEVLKSDPTVCPVCQKGRLIRLGFVRPVFVSSKLPVPRAQSP